MLQGAALQQAKSCANPSFDCSTMFRIERAKELGIFYMPNIRGSRVEVFHSSVIIAPSEANLVRSGYVKQRTAIEEGAIGSNE